MVPQNMYKRLLRWKDVYAGKKVILLCNGPSLNQVDFSRINRSDYTFFGLNKIYLGFDQLGVRPDFIAAVNRKVIEQSLEAYRSLPIVKFLSNRVDVTLIDESPYCYHMNTADMPVDAPRFSEDIVNYVHEGWTVTHAALQIIYYMGFSEVTIVGMDHQFTQHVKGKENQVSVLQGADEDHFSPQYFGYGQSWDLPDLLQSEISYQAAREKFEADGRKIYDCTIGGKCTIFERNPIQKHLYSH